MSRSDALYDDDVADAISELAERIHVDVDGEWGRLANTLATADSPHTQTLPRLLLIAAAIAFVLLTARPVIVSGTLATYNYVREVAGFETTTTLQAQALPLPPATTTTTTTVAPTPTTTPAVTTTVPPATTTTTAAPPRVNAGHQELVEGTEYERAIRQVHIQLNNAIGFQRLNFAALDGADDLVGSLLGQQPGFDSRLRDTIGHLREAQRASNRDAASNAHTIITSIEQELGTAGRR